MRNIIVTGGSRGLGLAITRHLAARGDRVIVIARSLSAELDACRRTLPPGGAIEFSSFDLAQTQALSSLIRQVRSEFGPIFGLVNNAGIGTGGVLSNMADGDIESLIRINTLAPILVAKYVLRSMLDQGEGRIINVASIVASTGYAGLSVYSATKASLVGFTRSLAREVGALGITVNAIAPGFIDTAMTGEMTAEQRDKITRRSALRRLPGAEDVAAGAEFLLSEGGRNITGTVLTIDAGNTA